ncbi:MAG: cobalamin-dependent protein [Desulfuromonadales bacterium]
MMPAENRKPETTYQAYLEALIRGDRHRCRAMVEEMLKDEIDIRDLYTGIFQRSLYQVGELWESNKLTVACEHMATAITESLLPLAYQVIFSAPHCGRKAVVACAANEYHQLGGKMVADILELNGWDGYFLGANTPVNDLLALVDEKRPDMLCLSLSVYTGMPELITLLDRVRGEFSALPVIVGGQAFRWGGVDLVTAYSGVRHIGSIFELEHLVQEW